MRDRDLESLIRMMLEIDELDRTCARDSRRVISGRALFRRMFVHRLTIPLAAAIALLYLLIPSGQKTNLSPRHVAPTFAATIRPFDVSFCPLDSIHTNESTRSSNDANYKVLAIFQTWWKECECHAWQLYEWEDNRSLAEMTPEQIQQLALDVTGAPPLEELLVVAIAPNADDLPLCEPESCELVDCLNDVAPAGQTRGNAAEYASAVRACLPDTVRVVSHSSGSRHP